VDEASLRRLLDAVQVGAVTTDDALDRLRRLPFADLGFARVDHHRVLRQGMAEAVYGPGKTPEQCAEIVAELLAAPGDHPVLLTRADDHQVAAALARHPDGHRARSHPDGHPAGPHLAGPGPATAPHGEGPAPTPAGPATSTVTWRPAAPRPERVVVATAGTADLPVAEECVATLAAHGIDPVRLTDVGVAGVHRLLASTDVLADADAVIVIAGMEGALASLVGGITPAPVVAVPTSAGYGASLGGVTALLAMLASCAAGLTVVGIDNGFGAACAVLRMVK
jgi:hypothetical protein